MKQRMKAFFDKLLQISSQVWVNGNRTLFFAAGDLFIDHTQPVKRLTALRNWFTP